MAVELILDGEGRVRDRDRDSDSVPTRSPPLGVGGWLLIH